MGDAPPAPATSGYQASDVLPRGHLRGCLLLLLAERPAHGYDLATRLDDLGLAGTDGGTVYRLLRTLDREGLVRSAWVPHPPQPPRRVYEITPMGTAELAAWTGALSQSQAWVRTFLHRQRKLYHGRG